MEELQAVLAIVLIDLALSGDNALVIGMAARGLPPEQRRRAIVLGGGLAVVLRVAAAAIVTLLLAIPFLQLLGGVVLAVLAYRLVRPVAHAPKDIRAATSLREAMLTIVVADAAMSLENVLGVGGAARGDIALLAFGIGLSLPIVLFGSGLVAALIERWPSTIWLGAFALVWTAADMILEDPFLGTHVPEHWWIEAGFAALLLAAVALARRLEGARG